MKKMVTFALATSVIFASLAPTVAAEPPTTIEVSAEAPASLGEVSSYKKFDSGINLNARITAIDREKLAQNKYTANAGDRRVYIKSDYVAGSVKIAAYNVGPMTDQQHLVSIAKGKEAYVEKNTTVSGSLKLSGSYNQNVLGLVKASLNLEASGTVSKTWTTSQKYFGPKEDSIYNSRSIYGAIDYDLYNITVVQYDTYDEYLGNQFQQRITTVGKYHYVNNTKKPFPTEYSIESFKK
ncbi:hypothetical protein SAMN05444162_3632 [Paenibacillaceae bacterium GAS479]|nr:hypothetical protein SAMN05444162_3632 [Paenibacillaceae bacterium GAS479]